MLMPPESKQTPLPMIARCRPRASFWPSFAGAHDDHPGRVVAPLPHRQEHAHAELARALGLDDVDPQAVALGDRPGLVGEDRRADVVRGAVGERPGGVRALADDPATVGGLGECRRIRPGRDEDELVDVGRGRFDRVAVDGLGLVGALDDAPRHEFRDRFGATVDMGRQVGQPDGQALDLVAAEAPLDRGADVMDRLAVDLLGRAGRDRDDTLDRDLPGCDERRAELLSPDLAEREERLELPAGPPIELSPRTIECQVAHERDGEDVGGDLPGLIRQDAHVHVEGFLRVGVGDRRSAGIAWPECTVPKVAAAPRSRRGAFGGSRRAGSLGPGRVPPR